MYSLALVARKVAAAISAGVAINTPSVESPRVDEEVLPPFLLLRAKRTLKKYQHREDKKRRLDRCNR